VPSPSATDLAARVKPGPRYTSYPPATCFTPAVGADQASAALAELGARAAPISLYVHVPFCPSLCWYCGCNVEITRNRSKARAYVDLLIAELDLVAERAGHCPVRALSLGGGSPNFLAAAELARLVEAVDVRFGYTGDAELHVELDPRETSLAQVETLGALGFTRLSVGVQDFSPEVQEAIHRVQSLEQTARLVGAARDAGFRSINVDLIYGLPHQTPATFAATLDRVLLLHPDRMALFGYAHIPHLRPQQRLVTRNASLPGPVERARLLLGAFAQAEAAGYVRIGLDHLATPEDDLVQAARDGTLDRNFQGYVVRRTEALIGIGASSISDTGGLYWQNQVDLLAWQQAVAAGRLPIARGVQLDEEDRLRRHVIMRLMCDGALDVLAVERAFDIHFESHFAEELARLDRDDDGLLLWDAARSRLVASEAGALLIRNVCMAFDRHLPADPAPGARPRHSLTL
jgi:oxygen-independent coproporphyrinogen III oxidase